MCLLLPCLPLRINKKLLMKLDGTTTWINKNVERIKRLTQINVNFVRKCELFVNRVANKFELTKSGI